MSKESQEEARKLREKRREEKLRRLRAERRPAKANALNGPPSQTAPAELSREERARVLAAEVYTYTKHDYEVKYSTGTTAHLVWKRPKPAFAANLFLTVITLGFWLIIWIPLGLLGGLFTPKHVYIEVLPDGTVEKNTHGWR